MRAEMWPQGRTSRHSLRLADKGLWMPAAVSAEYLAEKMRVSQIWLVNQGRVILRVGQQGSILSIRFSFACFSTWSLNSIISRPRLLRE